jgi:3'-5' exoribonuclease
MEMFQQALTDTSAPERVAIRDLDDGGRVEGVFAVRERELRRKRNGDPWLRLSLGDAGGTVEAVSWEDAEARYALAGVGPVFVTGVFEVSDRWGSKIKVADLREAAPEEYRAADLAPESDVSFDRLEADLRALLGTVQNAQLRVLLDAFFGEGSETWARFRDAPAAKVYHQAYRHGLLEHTLSVAQAVSAAAAFFPGIDRDVAIAGALLHDLGKLRELSYDVAVNYSVEGNLVGHIVIGVGMLRDAVREQPGFPAELQLELEHLILSHHGARELGSPVEPMTVEAFILAATDDLDAKLHQVRRHLADDSSDGPFTGYHRYLERVLFKGQGPDTKG